MKKLYSLTAGLLAGLLLTLAAPLQAAYAPGITAGTNTTPSTDVVTVQTARANAWSYAAASGGITNTTAVTIKAAAGASVKNCLTSIQVINGHATVSTEVLVRDGAAGTVIFRGFAQAAGGGFAFTFSTPLCGTANTLMEVVNGTTGSAVYVNAQGFTGG